MNSVATKLAPIALNNSTEDSFELQENQIGIDVKGRQFEVFKADVNALDDAEGYEEFKAWSNLTMGPWTAAAVVTTFLALAALLAAFLVPGLAPILFVAAAILAVPAVATIAMTVMTSIVTFKPETRGGEF